jgi:ABC-type glycerol-3-phosphate transport system permease component
MKSAQSTAFSGCLICVLLVFILSTCILPVATAVGGFSSSSDYAIKTTGNWLCPDGTTPESYSYASTTTDEFGNSQPATAYELHCVDASGNVVKNDPIAFAFIWIGIFMLAGLILAVVLSFVFAVPGGMLVTKLLNKLKSPKANISA